MLFTYTLEGSQLRYPGSFSELIEYSICSKLYQHRIHIFAYYACDAEECRASSWSNKDAKWQKWFIGKVHGDDW